MRLRRRFIAALAVFVPVVAVTLLKRYFPLSYDVLGGYMVAVALVFKSALLSFYSASKLKLFAFLKGLTLVQGLYLLLKRWFLDNVFSRWLRRNILRPVRGGVRDLFQYYSVLNLKAKIKNIFLPLLLAMLSVWAIYISGYLDNLLLFTELKVLIIGLSKTVLAIGMQFFGWLFHSWISPILEVFALSWFLSWFEKVFGEANPLVRAYNWMGAYINAALFWVTDLNRRHIDPLLNDRIAHQSQKLSAKLSDFVRHKKIDYEYEQFTKLENRILKAHIDAYHHFKGMEQITEKRALYRMINRRTDDNLDIVAFVSRNQKGDLLPEAVEDAFYHDIFILEGIASSHRHGVREEQPADPDHSDFWILNTSAYPVTLQSHSGHIPTQKIAPHSLTLIQTAHAWDDALGDIYFEFRGRSEVMIAV